MFYIIVLARKDFLMIARKIEKAAQTLGNIKLHLEPAVWRTMCVAINILLEAAAEVRVLEKRSRSTDASIMDAFMIPAADGTMTIDMPKLKAFMENMIIVLDEYECACKQSGPGRCASVTQPGSGPDLTMVPAPEVN